MQSEHFSNRRFCLGPRTSTSARNPFHGSVSHPYGPVGFHSQAVQGLVPLVQVPGLRCPMWGANPSLLREELQTCEILLDCRPPSRGWGFWQDHVSASPISTWPLFPSLWRSRSAGFRFFFSRTGSTCSLRAGVSREVATSGPSHAAISDHTHQG